MNAAVAMPVDVKLMNTTAVVLLVAFVVGAAFAMARWAVQLPAFDIKDISVSGEVSHNNNMTLRANVTQRLQGTFFTVDLARVKAAFEAVPWVRRAVVRRVFPNRLQVILQEHQAVAYWGGEDEDEMRLLNSYGEVFEANVGEVEQDTLAQLDGPEGQAPDVLAMYRVVAPLFAQVELTVDRFELTRGGSWHAHLDSGANMELGPGTEDEVVSRVQRYLKTLAQVTSRYERRITAVETADLRYESGYAIRLRGVSTVVADSLKK